MISVSQELQFRLLGPLEVARDGEQLGLGPPKQRALLALLLLHPNEVVSTGRLVASLWPATAPRTAPTALHGYVSGLRKLLGPDRVETRSGGYVLRVDAGELDLDRFQQLVAEADRAPPAEASRRLGEALALWRGPPLAEVGDEPFAQGERARLEELRLGALERRIDGDLAGGRGPELVPELEALVHGHPLREGLRARLMMALYRSGRQADALAAYERGRKDLVDQLGLEPGMELRELQRRILEQDASLLPAASAPAASAPAPATPAPAPVVAAPAATAEDPTRRVVTVLFSDIVNSSEVTARLDPEVFRNVIRRYFEVASAALERHGGTVEKFIGDAVMAVFGIPRVEEDDALRAVRAAVEMRSGLMELNQDLRFGFGVELATRVGVNTGEVVAGNAYAGGTLVTGRAVVVARRLEQSAGADEILIGRQTYDLVRDAVVAEETGPLSLKGIDETVDGWRVLDVRPEAAGVSRNFDAPLVDRERERALLEEALRRAVDTRSCQLITLLGMPGIGKTRLGNEFAAGLEGRARVLKGRCLSYGEGITFWPIREIVRRAAGIAGHDSPDVALAKIAALLPGDEAAPRAAEAIAAAIGLTAEPAPTDEIFAALRRVFERLASERPLVLVLEDINWGEPTLLDLIEYLAGWSRSAPLLVLCLARPDLLELRPSWISTQTVPLEPLSEHDMRTLIANTLDGAESSGIADRVGEMAEGNPLFAEEMVRMLVDEAAPADVAEVPPTIHALLLARLDRLDVNERAIVGAASVIGRQFGWSGVTELAPPELRPRVGASLQELVRKRIVLPDEPTSLGEDAFRFSHILMRDAAYRSLPKVQVAELHERFADWLERRIGDRQSEFAEILGYHLEQAAATRVQLGPRDARAGRLAERAGVLLGSAGARALAREDVPAATTLLERAAILLVDDGEPLVAVLVNLAAALRESGDLARAAGVLDRAIERGEELGLPDLRAQARLERSSLRMLLDPAVEATELLGVAEEAVSWFHARHDHLGLARARIHVAEVQWMRCRCREMETVLEAALHCAEHASAHREVSTILLALSRAALVGPRPVDAAIARVGELGERLPGLRPALRAEGEYLLAALEAMRGNGDEARTLIESGKRTLEEFGLTVRLASVQMYAAWAELSAGDPEAAESELRPAYESLARMGEHSYLSTTAGVLAQVLYEQGRYDEAERVAHTGEAWASSDDVSSQVYWRGVAAKTAARRGEYELGERLARRAAALAARTDFVTMKADAYRDLGEVLSLAGRRSEAAAAFRETAELHDAKGNLVAARRVRDRLRAVDTVDD